MSNRTGNPRGKVRRRATAELAAARRRNAGPDPTNQGGPGSNAAWDCAPCHDCRRQSRQSTAAVVRLLPTSRCWRRSVARELRSRGYRNHGDPAMDHLILDRRWPRRWCSPEAAPLLVGCCAAGPLAGVMPTLGLHLKPDTATLGWAGLDTCRRRPEANHQPRLP